MKNSIAAMFILAVAFTSCSHQEKPRDIPRYSIEQFYKNTQIRGGAFSPDETKLLVSSNESGIYNLYEITIADSSRRALSSSTTESYFAVDYVPGTGEIIYSADKGGNEITHLHLLRADGSTQDLTPAPNEKASFALWSGDKKAFYYLSNKRDEKFFDLYRMDVGTWKAALIYKNDQGFQISDISWDGKSIALARPVTTSENSLFLHNIASGATVEISDPAKPGSYDASGFSRDNASLYYITDAGGEFQSLHRYEIATTNRTPVLETAWDVMYSSTSENDKYQVIGVNEDGKNRLRVIDLRSGKDVPFPSIPDGDVLSVSISRSEDLMRLTVGTSKAPSNLYVYRFATNELKKLTHTLNPEIDQANLVSAEVVRYKSFDGLEIPAIYYKPLTASPRAKVPALIWVHGGPGGQSRVGYSSLIQYLVNHGYAILAVNNRGSSGYGRTFYKMDDRNHGEKDLMDCIYGKKFLAGKEYIDGEKVGIIGGSYGGYMTMAAMTFHPEEFRVGVNIFGVTNWLRTLRSIPPYWESFRKALYAEMGDPATDSLRLYNISPLFHASRIQNPVMVLQGANDPRVLQIESDEIVDAMKKNNIPVEYVVFPDEGHGFVKKENEIRGYNQIREFLEQYLKGTSPKKPA